MRPQPQLRGCGLFLFHKMTQKPIRLIILDFDGTLADTSVLIISTTQATLQALNLPVATAEQIKRNIGLPLVQCFTRLMPMDDATAQRCVDTYRVIFDQKNKELSPRPFPHVEATLRKLHAEGISLAIASSRSTASLENFIGSFNWQELFSEAIGSDKVEKAKPDPDPVNHILADLNFKPEDTLVVGDAPYDILMGKNAGTRTCAVTYGNATRQSLLDAGPDWVIDDFERLNAIAINR